MSGITHILITPIIPGTPIPKEVVIIAIIAGDAGAIAAVVAIYMLGSSGQGTLNLFITTMALTVAGAVSGPIITVDTYS